MTLRLTHPLCPVPCYYIAKISVRAQKVPVAGGSQMTQHTEPGTEPVFCSCERWDFWCIVSNLFIQQMPIPAVCLLPPVPIVSVRMASIQRSVWTGNVPASAMMSTLNLSVLSYPQGPPWVSEDIQLSWTAPPLGRHLPCDIPGPHFVFLPHMG